MYVGKAEVAFGTLSSANVPKPSGIEVGQPFSIGVLVESPSVTIACAKAVSSKSVVLVSTYTIAVLNVIHDGSETYSVTWGGASLSATALSFGFGGRGETFLTGEYGTGASNKSPSAPSITTPEAGYDLAWFCVDQSLATATPPEGMTERHDNFTLHLATQDGISEGATGAKTGTFNINASWAAILIGYAPEAEEATPRGLTLLGAGR